MVFSGYSETTIPQRKGAPHCPESEVCTLQVASQHNSDLSLSSATGR